MKASKFSDAQKAFLLKQEQAGTPVAQICREAGISQATYYNWKKKYGGMMPSEMKKLVADLSLDKEMLQDVIKRKL